MKKKLMTMMLASLVLLGGMNQVDALTATKIDLDDIHKGNVNTKIIEINPAGKSLVIETDAASYNKTAVTGGETISIDSVTIANKVTVKYGSVGTYEGMNVSAILTIDNIIAEVAMNGASPRYTNTDPTFTFYESLFNGIVMKNVREFDVEVKFFTGANFTNQIDFDGSSRETYLTFTSLSSNRCVVRDTEVTTYLTNDTIIEDTLNTYTNENMWCGTDDFYIDELGEETYANAAISFKLTGNSSKFTLAALGSNYGVFLMNNSPLFSVIQNTPVKHVYNTKNEEIDQKAMVPGGTYYYTIEQTFSVLGQDMLARYNSFQIVDTLPSNISVQSIEVLDTNGTVLADAGNVTNQLGRVTYDMCDELLENTLYNGEKYYLKITFKVKDELKACTQLKNKATTSVNDYAVDTNEVMNPVNCVDGNTPTLPQTGLNDFTAYIGLALIGLSIGVGFFIKGQKHKTRTSH